MPDNEAKDNVQPKAKISYPDIWHYTLELKKEGVDVDTLSEAEKDKVFREMKDKEDLEEALKLQKSGLLQQTIDSNIKEIKSVWVSLIFFLIIFCCVGSIGQKEDTKVYTATANNVLLCFSPGGYRVGTRRIAMRMKIDNAYIEIASEGIDYNPINEQRLFNNRSILS